MKFSLRQLLALVLVVALYLLAVQTWAEMEAMRWLEGELRYHASAQRKLMYEAEERRQRQDIVREVMKSHVSHPDYLETALKRHKLLQRREDNP